MTKQEFETRVQMQVTETEYRSIEEVYMNSDVDKDEFCKYWSKMNHKRVEKAIKAQREAVKLAELKEKFLRFTTQSTESTGVMQPSLQMSTLQRLRRRFSLLQELASLKERLRDSLDLSTSLIRRFTQ